MKKGMLEKQENTWKKTLTLPKTSAESEYLFNMENVYHSASNINQCWKIYPIYDIMSNFEKLYTDISTTKIQ